MKKLPLLLLYLPIALPAMDPGCPRYPETAYLQQIEQIDFERSAANFAKTARRNAIGRTAGSNNFIDDFIFNKMAAAGIAPAPPTTDAEFVRRIYLDLTGRIPTTDQVVTFLNDTSAGKRNTLIQSLIGTDAFVDYWTLYLANKFEVTSGYYNEIPIEARNLFHSWLRDSVKRDKPYNELVTELLTASGMSTANGPVNFLVRGWQDGDPIQDTWDTLTDRVTTRFLGIKTECISCHDGRRHLEQINLYLTPKRRQEFWRLSAFFSRMSLQRIGTDIFNQGIAWNLTDRSTGGYYTAVNPTTPGPRPSRRGGVWEPAYLFTGAEPESGNYRQELAKLVTQDRQFARVAVNYLWAHFFRRGIVDPPDAWDLDRVDPKNPPPAPWPMQSSHPELLEALTDAFINSGYRIRPVIRLMVESNAWQLSSRYEGQWKAPYAWYFAKQTPRRLSAEELYDALITATQTEVPMYIHGFAEPIYYAGQLPDPMEPRSDFNIRNFLTQFGRGDWWTIPRKSSPSLLQVLYLMNDYMNVSRSLPSGSQGSNTRVARLSQAAITEDEAIKQLFLATLSRTPTRTEQDLLDRLRKGNRDQWLSDVQWSLINKLDFIFNY